MTFLALGLILWWAAHLAKRLTPGFRAALTARLGEASKGLFAVTILLSVVLMVIGYKSADGVFLWGRSAATTGINNIMVLLAFYMFAASGSKTRVTQYTRHPQLIGFSLWAAAHLLVNGDTVSVYLFGSLLVWALFEMVIISLQDGPYERPEPAPARKEIGAVVGAVVLYGIVAGIHTWLGYFPFGS